jgi:hypothetical protein
MRNKFTELIEQGVARFEYTPIAPEIPEQDPICRQYNNIWSIPSDTHMHLNHETGDRYITGHMVGIASKWDSFVYAHNWGAVKFKTTGYWCLCDFLQKNGLCGHYSVLNGDTVYLVTPITQDEKCLGCPCTCPTCCTTSESKIPQPIASLVTGGDINKIKECYQGKSNLYEVCAALNENLYVKGENWTVNGNKLVCPIGNKVVIL